MSRPMSLREYAELHEDPERDNRIADAMLSCAACGRNFLPGSKDEAEEGLCPSCADAVSKLEQGRI